MPLPPERIEYYTKTLKEQLQQCLTSVKNYQAVKAAKTADFPNKVDHAWELYQRSHLLKGTDRGAAVSLIFACNEVYKGMYGIVKQLNAEVIDVSIHAKIYERECLLLTKEQNSSAIPVALKELIDLIKKSEQSLVNQSKFMKLHLRQLHPNKQPEEDALVAFKSDLKLPEDVEAHIAFGLAKIEHFLQNYMHFSQEIA